MHDKIALSLLALAIILMSLSNNNIQFTPRGGMVVMIIIIKIRNKTRSYRSTEIN